MSQIIVPVSAGSLPPSVLESFVTDSGTVIPALYTINFVGGETNVNADAGIRVIANPTTSNNMVVQLTNRITGTVTTTDATPTTLVTLNMGATPGIYYISGDVVAYNVTDTVGGAYSYTGAARTSGVVGTEIAVEGKDVYEEVAMAASDIALSVTGNNALITVTGIVGKTIHWNALFTYRFVG